MSDPDSAVVMKHPDILPNVLAQISLGRAGQPREMGTVAAFFASDDASSLTGQSIHVAGGWEGKSLMRADWTPEAESRLRAMNPRMVPCPSPDVHATVEILGRRCTATDLTNDISPDNESLRNLDRIPRGAFTFVGLPLKIRNGRGSPIRAVALTED